jgi:hypothetical protein
MEKFQFLQCKNTFVGLLTLLIFSGQFMIFPTLVSATPLTSSTSSTSQHSNIVICRDIPIDFSASTSINQPWLKKMGSLLDNIKSTPQGLAMYKAFKNRGAHIKYHPGSIGGVSRSDLEANVDEYLFNQGMAYATQLLAWGMDPSVHLVIAPDIPEQTPGTQTVSIDGIPIDLPPDIPTNGRWIQNMKLLLDNIKHSPEGLILYRHFQATKQRFVYHKGSIGGANASGRVINVDEYLFNQGLPYATEIVGHEMTHATGHGRHDTKNEESLASAIGRTIRYEKYGPFTYGGSNDSQLTFSNTSSSAEESYKVGVQESRKGGGYVNLPEGTQVFTDLQALGFPFHFNLRAVP